MASAKKLPSGQWRTLVYDYTDSTGKRHYESFTAGTKKESEYMAAEFALNKKNKTKCNYTFKEAMAKYIDSKNNLLSPSSIRGYKQMCKYYASIENIRLNAFDTHLATEWANEFSVTHSPKTVRNAHGLISAILKEYAPEIILRTTLPQKIKPTYNVPSDDDIKKVISYYQSTNADMLMAVYLAAFGTLRRSEICALNTSDISGNVIHVSKAMVKNQNRIFEVKTTKTVSSDRYVELPDFIIQTMPSSGNVVSITPDIITHTFGRTLKKLGIKHFRFHDLRHYSASIMHAIGIPDQYIMIRGGWQSDTVLKQVYRGTMDDYQIKFANMTNSYFENMQHEMQHGNKKSPKN